MGEKELSSSNYEIPGWGYFDQSKEFVFNTVAPASEQYNVTWSSDNEAVATVVNGVVTAVSEGTANITVTSFFVFR